MITGSVPGTGLCTAAGSETLIMGCAGGGGARDQPAGAAAGVVVCGVSAARTARSTFAERSRALIADGRRLLAGTVTRPVSVSPEPRIPGRPLGPGFPPLGPKSDDG